MGTDNPYWVADRNPWRRFRNFLWNNRDVIGVYDGRRAYSGPWSIQIDPTNDCNNNCIACWCNSPHLGELRSGPEVRGQRLSREVIEGVLDDAVSMGLRDCRIAGGGEPFLHPEILEILDGIKRRGLTGIMNTNFTRVDRRAADRLIAMRWDYLSVSLWAASPAVYVDTHPGRTEADFLHLRDRIEYLNRARQGGPPHVIAYNVISSRNAHEVEAMVEFARATNCDEVEFAVVDVIPGKTDFLLLSEAERERLVSVCRNLAGRRFVRPNGECLHLAKFDQFLRRVSHPGCSLGESDRAVIDSLPCYAGWTFARVLADGNINSCLKSHRIPVGNVNRQRFRDIWFGAHQDTFRRCTRRYMKRGPIFGRIGNDLQAEVGCYRGCDDLDRNLEMHWKLGRLHPAKRLLLRAAAAVWALRGNGGGPA